MAWRVSYLGTERGALLMKELLTDEGLQVQLQPVKTTRTVERDLVLVTVLLFVTNETLDATIGMGVESRPWGPLLFRPIPPHPHRTRNVRDSISTFGVRVVSGGDQLDCCAEVIANFVSVGDLY